MYKIDLHTHSTASPDGGITPEQYAQIIEDGLLDYVAITDHNTITGALEIKKQLGRRIIVGEEIEAQEGEIIGLFIKESIPANLTALETVQYIKQQGGLVYIPHPFETVRKGISQDTLRQIMDFVDIIEAYNGRAVFQNKGPEATKVSRLNNIPVAASSDAHGVKGIGTAFSQVSTPPTSKNLPLQLATAKLAMRRPPLRTLLYPKLNRLTNRWLND